MYAIVKTVATILSLVFFIDRVGRRNLLLTSSIGTSLALWYIGGFVTAAHVDLTKPQPKTIAGWIAIVCVYIYAVSSNYNSIPISFRFILMKNPGILLLCLEWRRVDILRRNFPNTHQRASDVPQHCHAMALSIRRSASHAIHDLESQRRVLLFLCGVVSDHGHPGVLPSA